ncbi:chromate efflux transporter [Parerythrobacter lacustris]|uniref:Chromate efflux transporter n=1 Tax=Parerythrobacter lacustris TaxID=2969984 RepID=A0ABT1XP18_9SPHN|nr:chromate efflux transporter [Parerythrobacter lacustris]MCR2833406.1 chromate efflux transporter [Parerythrobacter lacustris]
MEQVHLPSLREAVAVYARIGCLSFGGPAGQIALMHRELVEERCWVSEDDYLAALNFCHLLPGPEAQQLATWIGWRLHGTIGGIAAGTLFVIPGALVMLALSLLYAFAADLAWFEALFLGIKAAVFAIVVQALLRIAGRALDTGFKRALALTAFIALAVLALPFPLVILLAGLAGAVVAAMHPQWLALKPAPSGALPLAGRPWRASLKAILIWGAAWALPFVAIFLTLGTDHVLWDIATFFSQLAVVTFGGAYAVLAYMAQEAVGTLGWLRPGEMADGLGLAETTPGPLILVTQFVGFLAGFRFPEPLSPMAGGLLGAIVTLWVTFAPCFLWIFALAPWIERLRRSRKLAGALSAITASIVGVIANLALWFALHVLFARLDEVRIGRVAALVPEWASLDWRAALLSVAALVLVFALRWNLFAVLGTLGAGGLLLGSLA